MSSSRNEKIPDNIVNKKLYSKVKKEAKEKFEIWPSRYGSGWLTKEYKKRGGTYSGSKPSKNEGQQRWDREKWKDEKGNDCGSSKNKNIKKCRPTVRITSKTPITWNEMTKKEKENAIKEKKKIGMGKKTSPIK